MVNVACAVNTSPFDQTVNFEQICSKRLKIDGAKNDPIGFTVELNNRDSQMSANVGIVFSDPAITGKIDTLTLQGSATGSTTDVGVQITSHTGKVIPLDGTASSTFTLTDGTNKTPFQTAYYAAGQVTVGIANADVTFRVQCQ